MEPKLKVLSLPAALPCPATLTCIKVQVGDQVRNGTVLATYTYQSSVKGCGQGAEGCGQGTEGCGNGEEGCGERTKTFKSTVVGKISSILQKEGDVVEPRYVGGRYLTNLSLIQDLKMLLGGDLSS